MSDLTVANSTYPTTKDTASALSGGNAGNVILAQHINGGLSAIINIENEIGRGLKGLVADLATRLAVNVSPTGGVPVGTAFPSSPTPVDGQLFKRTDLNQLYMYDGGSAQWTRIDGVNDHGLLGGLGDDDHTHYLTTGRHDLTARHGKAVLPSAIAYEDEANTFSANQTISKSVPTLILQETGSAGAVIEFKHQSTSKINLVYDVASDELRMDDIGVATRVGWGRTTGKMTAGIVPMARMAFMTTLTFTSVPAGSQGTNQTIAHGLGTNNVVIILMLDDNANGSVSAASQRPDGFGAVVSNGGANFPNVSVPASGNVGVGVFNNAGAAQTIRVRVAILRED